MPIARFQMPDGRIARFEVPEGTTPEQAQSMIEAELPKIDMPQSEAVKIGKEAFPDALRQTLNETDWGTRNIAAAGTALSNLYEGGKQLVKGSELYNLIANGRFASLGDLSKTNPNIEASKVIRQEAPIGALAGDIAVTAPAFAMAGPSIPLAAGVGMTYAGMQPADTEGERLASSTVGGVAAGLGQALANKVSGFVSKKAEQLALKKSQNLVKDEALQESISAGYKVPPSMMPDTRGTSRTLEGLSGKYKTNQLAGIKNQEVTNSLAKQALGIADDQPLSISNIEKVREASYAPYKEISKLDKSVGVTGSRVMNVPETKSINPGKTLEELKQARSDAKSWFEAYNRSASPDDLTKARGLDSLADSLEKKLEDYAQSVGRGDLVPQLREARKMIAKTYTVERALQRGSGDVDAKVLGRLYQKGKPLSGGLEVAGKFGATFGDVAGIPKSGNASPLTALDFMQMGGMAPLGMIATGNPAGAMMATALPAARIASRYGLLSGPVQAAMANPSYKVPVATRMAGGLLRYSPVGATVLGVPAFRQNGAFD